MPTEKLWSNNPADEDGVTGGDDYAIALPRELSLRKYTSAPLTWEQLDNNFELLKQKANSLVDDREVLTAADATISSQVSGNATDIATNATAIATNTTAIATNTADIATNAADIAPLKTWKSENETFVEDIQSSISPYVGAKKLEVTPDWELFAGGRRLSSATGYVYAEDFCAADGVTDDTVALQAAIDSLGAKGGMVILGAKSYMLNKTYTNGGTITVKSNVTLKGPYTSEGFDSSGTFSSAARLIVSPHSGIFLNYNAGIDGCRIHREGLDAFESDSSSFSGTAIKPQSNDGFVINSSILGFEHGIYADWSDSGHGTHAGRFRARNLYMDNLNGIYIRSSWDICYIENVHMWPFVSVGAVNTDLSNYRSGVGIHLVGVNDWTKVTDCFTYGYQTGYKVDSGRNVTLKGCGADFLSGSTGIFATGYVANSKGFWLTDSGVTDYSTANSNWSLQPTGGAWNLIGCQSAAQEVGIEVDLGHADSNVPNPSVQIASSQTWACGTGLSVTGGYTMVTNTRFMKFYPHAHTSVSANSNAVINLVGCQFDNLAAPSGTGITLSGSQVY